MATPRQIQALDARRPFEPFQLHLSSGRTILITHPESIAYGAAGHEIAIFDQADFHLIDMRLMEIVELWDRPRPRRWLRSMTA
jgi:hypothetical protein